MSVKAGKEKNDVVGEVSHEGQNRKVTITIPGELPGLNEIIEQAKRHYAEYSKFKKENTMLVQLHARRAPHLDRINVTITWYCKNKCKDKDNIMAGQKFIFDGLQAAGVLDNDGWRQIGDVLHRFEVDKQKPRVEIVLEEVA